MASQMNVVLICKQRVSLMCLAYFVMLSRGVCITRQWQTSGRLVQELSVFTVVLKKLLSTCHRYKLQFSEEFLSMNGLKPTHDTERKRMFCHCKA